MAVPPNRVGLRGFDVHTHAIDGAELLSNAMSLTCKCRDGEKLSKDGTGNSADRRKPKQARVHAANMQ